MATTFTVTPRIGATAPVVTLDLVDDAVLTGVEASHLQAPDATAELVELAECRFTGVSLARSVLPKIAVTDTELATCDLAVLRVEDSTWSRVRLTDSRLTGVQFAGATCQLVEHERCLATDGLWRFATLRKVRFVECTLTGADFTGSRFEQVEFRDCDLTGADFSQVRVAGARFDNCTFDRTRGLDSLRGAEIGFASDLDALGLVGPLAAALGIRIS